MRRPEMDLRDIAVRAFILVLSGAGSAHAAGYPWMNHAAPYDFLFGNHFDTHQQTRLDRQGELFGFLYVTFTGAVSQDGFRVATHDDCNLRPCSAGWTLRGEPTSELATFVYQETGDHHTFLADRADIPMPGAHSHFHWLGADPVTAGETRNGYFLELQAHDTFCFVHHDADSFDAARTCEDDANNGIIVRPGTDVATHLNILGSFPGYGVP
jgi:hypothetical protein